MFLVVYRSSSAHHGLSEWYGSLRDSLFRFRQLVKDGRRDVKVMRYHTPPFPPSATHRQVALYVLKTLGCSDRSDHFVRCEAYDPGVPGEETD